MHKTEFKTPCGCTVTRGEALRAFVAAIYDSAKVCALFTTDEVFERVGPFSVATSRVGNLHVNDIYTYKEGMTNTAGQALRAATASSKLISVALRIAQKLNYCEPVRGLTWDSDRKCHSRPKRVWSSNITTV